MKREIFAAAVAVMALCSCKEKKSETQAEVPVEVAKEVVEETLPEKKEDVFLYGRPETLTERKEYKTEAEGVFLKTFVNDDNVNLRSAPGVNGKKLAKTGIGRSLFVMGFSDKREKIDGYDGYWVSVSNSPSIYDYNTRWIFSKYIDIDRNLDVSEIKALEKVKGEGCVLDSLKVEITRKNGSEPFLTEVYLKQIEDKLYFNWTPEQRGFYYSDPVGMFEWNPETNEISHVEKELGKKIVQGIHENGDILEQYKSGDYEITVYNHHQAVQYEDEYFRDWKPGVYKRDDPSTYVQRTYDIFETVEGDKSVYTIQNMDMITIDKIISISAPNKDEKVVYSVIVNGHKGYLNPEHNKDRGLRTVNPYKDGEWTIIEEIKTSSGTCVLRKYTSGVQCSVGRDIYELPDANSNVIGKAVSEYGDSTDASVSVFGLTNNGWVKIQSGDVIGFIPERDCYANRGGAVFSEPDHSVAAGLTANFGI